jgi:hypothetical protein
VFSPGRCPSIHIHSRKSILATKTHHKASVNCSIFSSKAHLFSLWRIRHSRKRTLYPPRHKNYFIDEGAFTLREWLGGDETVTLASDLMGRIVLDTESPSRLRAARDCFARWASQSPENAALQMMVAAIEARLKFLGKKEPAAVTISSRARDIADELDLPGNLAMLEFLSEAEILLEADGNDPEQTYDLMFQAGWEFATLMVEAGARRQIQ